MYVQLMAVCTVDDMNVQLMAGGQREQEKEEEHERELREEAARKVYSMHTSSV
jgi:hypothetical protein